MEYPVVVVDKNINKIIMPTNTDIRNAFFSDFRACSIGVSLATERTPEKGHN